MTDPAARTREVLMPYFDSAHADVSMMADDVVFVNMTTGDQTRTPQGVLGMLQYFYQIAFDATAEGGELTIITAAGNQVRVPLVIVYDVADSQIQRARIYLDMASMMAQLSPVPAG